MPGRTSASTPAHHWTSASPNSTSKFDFPLHNTGYSTVARGGPSHGPDYTQALQEISSNVERVVFGVLKVSRGRIFVKPPPPKNFWLSQK